MVREVHRDERRLHPFSWLFVLITQLRDVALPLVVMVLFGRGAWWEFLAIVGAVVLALYAFVYSFGFRYRIADGELIVREGIVDRTERHIPFARIQNIARRSNLLHRLFGVTELRLESGGGTKPEAVMKVLRIADADALVALLRERPADSIGAAASASGPSETVLLRLPLGELVRLGLISNRGMVIVAGLTAGYWQLGPDQPRQAFQMPFNWIERGVGEVASAHYGTVVMVMGGALLLVALIVALRVLSIMAAVVMHHGFVLERDGNRLAAGGGLFTHAQGSARIDRLQMLHVEATWLHRLFARMGLKTDVAGGARDMNDAHGRLQVLAPIATSSQVDALLAAIVGAPPLAELPWRALHPRAWRRRVRWPILFWLAATAAACLALGPFGLGLLFGVPWAVVSARGWAAFTRYAMDDRFLAFREGWLSRRYALIELDKVQAVSLKQSPFDRRHDMASISIDSMGASEFGSGIDIPCLPIAEARSLFAVLARRSGLPELSAQPRGHADTTGEPVSLAARR